MENGSKPIDKGNTGTNQSNPSPAIKPTQGTAVVKEISKIKYPRVISRLVYIRRKKTGPNLPVEGEFIDESIQKIGASYKNKGVLRGLEPKEEARWLSKIIGVQSTSDRWEDATKEYWASISALVPPNNKDGSGGLELETGMRYNTEEDFLHDENALKIDGAVIDPKGEPISISDYVLWRYCLKYSKVANSFEDINKSAKIEFYMFTKEKEVKDQKVAMEARKVASQLLYKNLSDRPWVDHMLRLLIQEDKESQVIIKDIPALEEDEKDVLLDKYMHKNPIKFYKYGVDKHLEMKSFIEVCIAVGLLVRIPNTQSVSLDGNTIGNTSDEVVSFLLNPQNNATLNQLKAQSALRPV